jgi:type IV secretory pathway protease TraF
MWRRAAVWKDWVARSRTVAAWATAPRVTRLLTWPERHPWVRRAGFTLATISLVLAAVSPWYSVAVRDDESLPQYAFFIIEKGAVPTRGNYVAFRMTEEYANRFQAAGSLRPYARVGHLWVKQAYGMAGDQIAVEGPRIFINGRYLATALEQDRYHQRLRTAKFPTTIPADQYYLGLPHPRSFDSKYIGLVALKDIQGVVHPLF